MEYSSVKVKAVTIASADIQKLVFAGIIKLNSGFSDYRC